MSGRPAATSDPKASSMIASVTGHEITSDLSIAERLAALKSDHIPAAPVRFTCTVPLESLFRVPLSCRLRRPFRWGPVRRRPARSPCDRRARSTARRGRNDRAHRLFARSVCSTRPSADLNAGELTVWVREYTTVSGRRYQGRRVAFDSLRACVTATRSLPSPHRRGRSRPAARRSRARPRLGASRSSTVRKWVAV